MKPGTTAYSTGLNTRIPFAFADGLTSTISAFPKEKVADSSAASGAAKKASMITSSPALRRISQRLILAVSELVRNGVKSHAALPELELTEEPSAPAFALGQSVTRPLPDQNIAMK